MQKYLRQVGDGTPLMHFQTIQEQWDSFSIVLQCWEAMGSWTPVPHHQNGGE